MKQPIQLRPHRILSTLVFCVALFTLFVLSNRQNIPQSGAEAMNDSEFVYCQSTVNVALPTHRFVTSVPHAPGGMEEINESLQRLDHEDIPRSLPDGTQLSIHGVRCHQSWSEMFDAVNGWTMGRANWMLDPDAPSDDTNRREVVLKILFKEQFDIANEIFPPAKPILGR